MFSSYINSKMITVMLGWMSHHRFAKPNLEYVYFRSRHESRCKIETNCYSAIFNIVINVSGCNSFSCSEFIPTRPLTLLFPSHLVAANKLLLLVKFNRFIFGIVVVVVVAKSIWQAPYMEAFVLRSVSGTHTKNVFLFRIPPHLPWNQVVWKNMFHLFSSSFNYWALSRLFLPAHIILNFILFILISFPYRVSNESNGNIDHAHCVALRMPNKNGN